MAQNQTLLSLPREIRDIIYGHLFENLDSSTIHFDSKSSPALFSSTETVSKPTISYISESHFTRRDRPRRRWGGAFIDQKNFQDLLESLPPITRACSQLYYESVLVWLHAAGGTAVVMSDVQSTLFITDWLDNFGECAWNAITGLRIENVSARSAAVYHYIISRCSSLHTLEITLFIDRECRMLLNNFTDGSYATACQYIISTYELFKIISIPKLRSLTLRSHFDVPVSNGENTRSAYVLMSWFKNALNRNGCEMESRSWANSGIYSESIDDEEEIVCLCPFD